MSSTAVARALRVAAWLAGVTLIVSAGGCKPETRLSARRKRAILAAVAREVGGDVDGPNGRSWVEEEPLVPGLFRCGHTDPIYNPAIVSGSVCLARGWRVHCDDEMLPWVIAEYQLAEHPTRFSPQVWARLVARAELVHTRGDVHASCRKRVDAVEPRVTPRAGGGVEVRVTEVRRDHHTGCRTYTRGVFRADAQRRTFWERHDLCTTDDFPWGGPSPARSTK